MTREYEKTEELKRIRTQMVEAKASAARVFDDAYPDVGMALPWKHFVNQALIECKLTHDDVYYEHLIGGVKRT